jgi:hypothetical protein
MGVPPGNRPAGLVSVPEPYVAGADTRGRQEGRPHPWSQKVIHEISGLDEDKKNRGQGRGYHPLVETMGFEPTTSALRTLRSPN